MCLQVAAKNRPVRPVRSWLMLYDTVWNQTFLCIVAIEYINKIVAYCCLNHILKYSDLLFTSSHYSLVLMCHMRPLLTGLYVSKTTVIRVIHGRTCTQLNPGTKHPKGESMCCNNKHKGDSGEGNYVHSYMSAFTLDTKHAIPHIYYLGMYLFFCFFLLYSYPRNIYYYLHIVL